MQAVHACIEEPEAHRTLGGAGEDSGASSKYGGPNRRRRREAINVTRKVRGPKGSHAEAGRRAQCWNTYAAMYL
eukprot:2588075-Pleurochrysis_carterae.AAC.1